MSDQTELDIEEEAIINLKNLLNRPFPKHKREIGMNDFFCPWDIVDGCVYGSYSSDFDQCAIETLCDIRDQNRRRYDLASLMFREMLCVVGLCEYGSNPGGCFATEEFRQLIQELIDRWYKFSRLWWEDNIDFAMSETDITSITPNKTEF